MQRFPQFVSVSVPKMGADVSFIHSFINFLLSPPPTSLLNAEEVADLFEPDSGQTIQIEPQFSIETIWSI